MTLSAIMLPQAPIVMSDVLLSHLGRPQVSLTPTGIIISPTAETGTYQPSSFVQKTILLNDDRVAFTGAGKLKTLQFIACDLKSRIDKGMDLDDLSSWLSSKQAVCGNSTSAMVAWLDDQRYYVGKVGHGVTRFNLGGDRDVFCCGSGTDWLKRNLIREANVNVIEVHGDFSFAERVRFLAISQTAQHLAQERFLGMRDAFGAGFQIAYYDGTRFVTVEQTVYLVFMVEHDKNGPVQMSLVGPVIVQRSNGKRLSFEQWIPESEEFKIGGEQAVLQTRVRYIEKVVPPLLLTKLDAPQDLPLSSGEHIAAQVIHVCRGRLIGLGSFQLAGDPRYTGVTLTGEQNKTMCLSLEMKIFEIWMKNFNKVELKPGTAPPG